MYVFCSLYSSEQTDDWLNFVGQKSTGFRASEMLGDSVAAVSGRASHHQLVSRDHAYLRQQQQQQQVAPNSSAFSPRTCSLQAPRADSAQFGDVIGFCAAGLRASSVPTHQSFVPLLQLLLYLSASKHTQAFT